jgi:Fe-S oxidoreductase
MGWIAMLTLIVAAFAMFGWSAIRRWQLLKVGLPASRFDHLKTRAEGTWRYAFRQEKMDYYNPAGIAHKLIFTGFILLLFRTLILWGRGFYPAWNLIVLAPGTPLGTLYEFAKDCIASLVVCGALVFVYYRVIRPQKRMSLSFEGLLILAIIITMMVADMIYDGASTDLVLRRFDFCQAAPGTTTLPGTGLLQLTPLAGASITQGQCDAIATITAPLDPGVHQGWSLWPSPAGSAFAALFWKMTPQTLILLSQIGFWTHSTLVLVFLNLLPHSKHFHVITAIPNVFVRDLTPAGRLKPMAENAEKLMEKLTAASEAPDPNALPIGVARIEHFSWKALLDFYTCTECGRCSDNCPAHNTGKILSPKHLTLALRDHLYGREEEFIKHPPHAKTKTEGAPDTTKQPSEADSAYRDAGGTSPIEASVSPDEKAAAQPNPSGKPVNLVPDLIHPDVLWACTTCRACEEQCPVLISYVDKIVDMRRNLMMIRNEFPHELGKPFNAMESNGNPWNLSRMDRAAWSDGLGLATMAEKPNAEVLYWVGCAASYDDRAKKIARATAKLMKQAGVDFAILGQEESCTGDPARRAGNELLFAMLAEGNAATLNGYREQGGVKRIVTTCPHCFNTLKNEYPDFGVKIDVIHHTDFLLGLLTEKKLVPEHPVRAKVVYHDSCYLGRYNGVYEPPREILRRIPGVELVEADYWSKQRGLCCGAGGAQMWMEEQNKDRVNTKRTLQLLDAVGAVAGGNNQGKTIASACPFCMTMLTDGLKSKSLEAEVAQMDVAELLEKSCAEVQPVVGEAPPVPPPPPPADAPQPEVGATAE